MIIFLWTKFNILPLALWAFLTPQTNFGMYTCTYIKPWNLPGLFAKFITNSVTWIILLPNYFFSWSKLWIVLLYNTKFFWQSIIPATFPKKWFSLNGWWNCPNNTQLLYTVILYVVKVWLIVFVILGKLLISCLSAVLWN